MRSARVRRREEDFLDAVASAFKVGLETSVVLPKAAAHVLKEGESSPALAKDSEAVVPEVTFVVGSEPPPGDAVGLTREAANDEIHDATPRAAVEGSEVSPNRRLVQGTVRHTRDQDRGGSDFPLHVADDASAVSNQSHGFAVVAAAGAEFEDPEIGTYSHISPPCCFPAAKRRFRRFPSPGARRSRASGGARRDSPTSPSRTRRPAYR